MLTSSTRSSLLPSNQKVLTLYRSKLFSQLTIRSSRDTVWILTVIKSTFDSYSNSARVTKLDSRCTRHFWRFWPSLESSCNSVRKGNSREDWILARPYRSSAYRHHSSPMALGALGGLPLALGERLWRRVLELVGVETIRGRHYRDCRTLQGLNMRTGLQRGRPHGRRKEFIRRSRIPCRAFLQTPKAG